MDSNIIVFVFSIIIALFCIIYIIPIIYKRKKFKIEHLIQGIMLIIISLALTMIETIVPNTAHIMLIGQMTMILTGLMMILKELW